MSIPSTSPYAQIQRLEVTSSLSAPAGSITNTHVTGSGSTAIDSSKVKQQRTYVYAQPIASNVAAGGQVTHVCYGAAATIVTLKAKLPTKCTGADTVVVTWYLNGASIGTVTFTTADADNTVKTATPSSTAMVAGDDIQVRITIPVSNTSGKGIAAFAVVEEYPA
jgi:hypothetical protein